MRDVSELKPPGYGTAARGGQRARGSEGQRARGPEGQRGRGAVVRTAEARALRAPSRLRPLAHADTDERRGRGLTRPSVTDFLNYPCFSVFIRVLFSKQSDDGQARADTDETPLLRHSDGRREEESPRLQGNFSVAALPRNDVKNLFSK